LLQVVGRFWGGAAFGVKRFFGFGGQKAGGGFLLVDGVVKEQEAFEDLLAGVGVDGVADAVVFGQIVHLVEVVAQVNVALPAVGAEDGVVYVAVELAQAQDA